MTLCRQEPDPFHDPAADHGPTTPRSIPGRAVRYRIDKSAAQEVNGDGRADLLAHVSTRSLALRDGDTSLALSGTLRTGVPFVGSDRVRVLQ